MPHEVREIISAFILMIGGVTCFISGMALVHPNIEEKLYGVVMLCLTVACIGFGIWMM